MRYVRSQTCSYSYTYLRTYVDPPPQVICHSYAIEPTTYIGRFFLLGPVLSFTSTFFVSLPLVTGSSPLRPNFESLPPPPSHSRNLLELSFFPKSRWNRERERGRKLSGFVTAKTPSLAFFFLVSFLSSPPYFHFAASVVHSDGIQRSHLVGASK